MKFPMAYFITWTTYGSWLPGDDKGSFDADGKYIPPEWRRREAAAALMVEEEVTLTAEQREIVERVIEEHCRHRGWVLRSRNVRTQHAHVVVSANAEGEAVREQLKWWGSRRLSEAAGLGRGAGKDGARKWWTEKGNIVEIETDRELEAVNRYVVECQ